jgi:diaminopimelate epimerase
MKTIPFDKMQGAGNDYVYVDASRVAVDNPARLAVSISDRHFGVGSDGLVLILPSAVADFRMRMFNADGSEAAMCGNASRCVGKYVYEKGMTDKTEVALETGSGVKTLRLTVENGRVQTVSVDMGAPRLAAEQVPVHCRNAMSVPIDGMTFTCVSMGNPHAVAFVESVAENKKKKTGRRVENHPLFPERTNVEFAQLISPTLIAMRVWERGSGETLACGTGACATLVAAVLNGRAERRATLRLLGGEVEVEWSEATNRVTLTGGAEWVFSGEWKVEG